LAKGCFLPLSLPSTLDADAHQAKKKKRTETQINHVAFLYLFGDKYVFSILPNQQRARSNFLFDFVHG
jgi:hypothetical protein